MAGRRKKEPGPGIRTVTRRCFLSAGTLVGGDVIRATLREAIAPVAKTVASGSRVLELAARKAVESVASRAAVLDAMVDVDGVLDGGYWQRAARQCFMGVTMGNAGRTPNKPIAIVADALSEWTRVGGRMVVGRYNGGIETVIDYEAKHYQETLLKTYTTVALAAHCATFIRVLFRKMYDDVNDKPTVRAMIGFLDQWRDGPAPAPGAAPKAKRAPKRKRSEEVEGAEEVKGEPEPPPPPPPLPPGLVALEGTMPRIYEAIIIYRDLVANGTTNAAMVKRTFDTMVFRQWMNGVLALIPPEPYVNKKGKARVWKPPQFNLVPWGRKASRCVTVDVKVMKGVWKRSGLPLPNPAPTTMADFFDRSENGCRLLRRRVGRTDEFKFAVPQTFKTDGYRICFPFQVPGKNLVPGVDGADDQPPENARVPVTLANPGSFWTKTSGLFTLASVPAKVPIPAGVKVIGVDPGIVNIVTTSENKRFTRAQYGATNLLRQARRQKTKPVDIKVAEQTLSAIAFRGNADAFGASIALWCVNYDKVQAHYSQPKAARSNMGNVGCVQRTREKVIRTISKNPTDVIAFGSGFKGQRAQRGAYTTPVMKVLTDHLAKVRRVLAINEYFTSQKCHRCRKQLIDHPKHKREKCCPHCRRDVDRDLNAALNIRAVFRSWVEWGERPPYLRPLPRSAGAA